MGQTTRLLAVAGDPVAHSLSPAMHNAAIRALGLDAVYVAARTTPRAFPGLVHALLEAGGALNVTVPFKRQAAGLVDHATGLVGRTGACNTIWGGADASQGDNTDVVGVRSAARELLAGRAVRRALLIGTGGSARGAAVALGDEWPGVEIVVRSRDGARAAEFAAWAAQANVNCVAAEAGGSADGAVFDLVVNATPLGLKPDDELPLEGGALDSAGAVLDLVYARGTTPLVRAARSHKIPAADGRGVLVAQGAAAFERFFDVRPPIAVMHAAVEDALRP